MSNTIFSLSWTLIWSMCALWSNYALYYGCKKLDDGKGWSNFFAALASLLVLIIILLVLAILNKFYRNFITDPRLLYGMISVILVIFQSQPACITWLSCRHSLGLSIAYSFFVMMMIEIILAQPQMLISFGKKFIPQQYYNNNATQIVLLAFEQTRIIIFIIFSLITYLAAYWLLMTRTILPRLQANLTFKSITMMCLVLQVIMSALITFETFQDTVAQSSHAVAPGNII